MLPFIRFNDDFTITKMIENNFYKNDFIYLVSENGCFWDDNTVLIDQKSHDYKKELEEPCIISKPKKIDEITKKIETDNHNKEDDNNKFLSRYKYKKKNFLKKERYIFWEFSQLDFDFQTVTSKEVKNQIVDFANKYGLLREGIKIISDKYSKNAKYIDQDKIGYWEKNRSVTKLMNTYYIILKGESLRSWLKEIIQMRSLVLLWKVLWKAIEENDLDILRKIFTLSHIRHYKNHRLINYVYKFKFDCFKYYKLFNSVYNPKFKYHLISYTLFPSIELFNKLHDSNSTPNKNNECDEFLGGEINIVNNINTKYIGGFLKDNNNLVKKYFFTSFKDNEIIRYSKILLNNLLKIKLTKLFCSYDNADKFPIQFNENGIKIVPPNLISYMWYEFYKMSQDDVDIKWCAVCGGPEDCTNKRIDWIKHKICINKESQRRFRELKAHENNNKTKENIVENWNSYDWNLEITIEDVEEWIKKKKKR